MLDLILNSAALLYLLCTLFLVLYLCGLALLLALYVLKRRQHPPLPDVPASALPSVTVQLPVYNEARVIQRLIEACTRLDYPPEKLHIQILDDSTDDTTAIITRTLHKLKKSGFTNISHLHRTDRTGYKAGALAHGMAYITTDCVAIFDADFTPPLDFLRATMPFFSTRPGLGLVQTRWGHFNADYNLLTRAQALNIDAHFIIEQTARNRGHLPMSMNGTGGIWRVEAIRQVGGWSSATLTEDLDLSYRALLHGWEFLYLPGVVVPGELPPALSAYKTQQARWATGSTQCLLRHSRALLHSRRHHALAKLMGLLHLSQYVVQPVILLAFLLTPLLLWGDMFRHLPDLRLMALMGVIPPLMIAITQLELYADWSKRLMYLPAQFVIAAALVLNNSYAVCRACTRRHEHAFERTPKYRITRRNQPWAQATPRRRIDPMTIAELLLALYALVGFYFAIQNTPALAPYMLTYALAFVLFAGWNLYQQWRFSA